LARDIAGIAFKSADAVAQKVGIALDDPKRVAAAVAHVLGQAGSEGHCFLPEPELLARTAELLALPLDTVRAATEMASGPGVIRDGDGVYLEKLKNAEESVARSLHRLVTAPPPLVSIDIEKALAWIEKVTEVSLAEMQR